MKSETIKKHKTKEIVYLEDDGRTVPVLKECLDKISRRMLVTLAMS